MSEARMNSLVTCPPSLVIAQQGQLMSAQESISAVCIYASKYIQSVSKVIRFVSDTRMLPICVDSRTKNERKLGQKRVADFFFKLI